MEFGDGTTSQKIRCIDDVRVDGINRDTIIPDQVLLSSFEFVGKVSDEIFRLKDSTPATSIILGAEDILEDTFSLIGCTCKL